MLFSIYAFLYKWLEPGESPDLSAEIWQMCYLLDLKKRGLGQLGWGGAFIAGFTTQLFFAQGEGLVSPCPSQHTDQGLPLPPYP